MRWTKAHKTPAPKLYTLTLVTVLWIDVFLFLTTVIGG